MSLSIQYTAAVCLTAFVVWKGIVPAWNDIGTDFSNYYTASRLLLTGRDTHKLYDDAWFNERIQEFGINERGKFSPFPPVTAFVMLPIARFDPMAAKRVWTIMNIGFLVLHVIILQEITGKKLPWVTNLTLLSGTALANNFRFGQLYLVLSCLIMISFLLWKRSGQSEAKQGSRVLAGTLLGIGAAVKYFPSVYLLPFGLHREWKIVAAAFLSLAGLMGLSIMVFGMDVHIDFFRNAMLPHLTGSLSHQTPYASVYQSWDSLLRTLFVLNPVENPAPLLEWPPGYVVGKFIVVALVLSSMGYALSRLKAYSDWQSTYLRFSVVAFAALVLLPASATYHFLLAIFPIALFAAATEDRQLRSFRIAAIAMYSAIGFLPLGFFGTFYGNGPEIVLAYPRLFLVSAIFGTVVWRIHRFVNTISSA